MYRHGPGTIGIAEVIAHLSTGKSKAPLMVTHCFPLEQAAETFSTAADPSQSIKVILKME